MRNTPIEWSHHTFNLWEGCHKISPACTNCYAEARDQRFHQGEHWGLRAPRRFHGKEYWRQPFKWDRAAARAGKRRRVFCGSLMDIFELHENPAMRTMQHEARAHLWGVIEQTPHLDWLLLTKRPENWRECLPPRWTSPGCPLPDNIWIIGVTVEDQRRAEERIPVLQQIPARIRFLSCEPLLRSLDLSAWIKVLQWVIAGAESRPGHLPGKRPTDVESVRDLRDQCKRAGVPFFLKQLVIDGALISRPELDGRQWLEFPTLDPVGSHDGVLRLIARVIGEPGLESDPERLAYLVAERFEGLQAKMKQAERTLERFEHIRARLVREADCFHLDLRPSEPGDPGHQAAGPHWRCRHCNRGFGEKEIVEASSHRLPDDDDLRALVSAWDGLEKEDRRQLRRLAEALASEEPCTRDLAKKVPQ